MNRIWQFYPTELGLYIRLADEIVPHLDRAGVSYSIRQPAAQAAKLILKSEGKAFLPETKGEAMDLAKRWGLLTPDARGDMRWSEPLSRADAAQLAIALFNLLERGCTE